MELFRNCGPLAPELLEVCARIMIDHDHTGVTSIDLSQVVSTEYRADAVIELRGGDHALVAAVIVEVQLNRDPDKEYSWPLYVAALRSKLRCPATLLVLTEEAAIARWARRPIDLGHPGYCFAPIVIEFEDLPRSIDPARAHKLPELAVLSVLAHPALETAEIALSAISPLPEDRKKLYFDVIMTRLPAAIRQMLESGMLQGYKYQSEYALRYYNKGRDEGLHEGREEGLHEGREEGLRAALLVLARMRLAQVTSEDEAAIRSLHDVEVLTELVSVLGQAGDPADVRTRFDRVIRTSPG